MADNVIRLPRPVDARSEQRRLGHYLRVGFNDHQQVISLLAEGEERYQGIVIDAAYATRHKELVSKALRQNLDVILDPHTQASAFIGGCTAGTKYLPWCADRPHRVEDFSGANCRIQAEKFSEFVQKINATEAIAQTHFILSHADRWFHVDIESANALREILPKEIPVIYSLALPISVFRDELERRKIIQSLKELKVDALWLKIENFGANETGAKTQDYIAACANLHELGVPIIADHMAGLPGLALLAFGAVGGMTHGVQVQEHFSTSHWRRAHIPNEGNTNEKRGGRAQRILVPQLGMLLSKEHASTLFESSSFAKSQLSCRDPHCCPLGYKDMLANPIAHYLRQRAREVEAVNRIPMAARPNRYLEDFVRRTSDLVARASGLGLASNELVKKLQKRQDEVGKFRGAIAHLIEKSESMSTSEMPLTRAQREKHI